MDQWFYVRDGRQQGPVSLQLLRRMAADGQLHPEENLVWNPSMKDWQPAGTVESLLFPEVAAVVAPSSGGDANPYAAPASPGEAATVDLSAPFEEIAPGSQPLDIIACVKRGCVLTWRNFGTMLGATLIYAGIHMALTLLDPSTRNPMPFTVDQVTRRLIVHPDAGSLVAISLGYILTAQIILTFVSAGYNRLSLDVLAGKKPTIGIIFGQGRKMLRLIGGTFVFCIAVSLGIVLLVLPAIFVVTRFGLFSVAIVDRDMGVLEAFKYSFTLTSGNSLRIIGLWIILIAMMITGLSAFGVGVLIAFPALTLAWLVAYRWMQFGDRVVQDDSSGAPLLK